MVFLIQWFAYLLKLDKNMVVLKKKKQIEKSLNQLQKLANHTHT